MFLWVFLGLNVGLCECISLRVCIWVWNLVCSSKCMPVCVRVCVCLGVSACLCVCVPESVCMYVSACVREDSSERLSVVYTSVCVCMSLFSKCMLPLCVFILSVVFVLMWPVCLCLFWVTLLLVGVWVHVCIARPFCKVKFDGCVWLLRS